MAKVANQKDMIEDLLVGYDPPGKGEKEGGELSEEELEDLGAGKKKASATRKEEEKTIVEDLGVLDEEDEEDEEEEETTEDEFVEEGEDEEEEETSDVERDEETGSDELQSALDEITRLKTLVDEMAGQISRGDEVGLEGRVKEKVKEGPPVETIDPFVSDEDFEDVITSSEKFNEVLLKVYKKGREDSLRDIPKAAARTVQRQIEIQELRKQFWEENKDLEPFKKYVLFKTQEIENANPGKPVKEILKMISETVRKDLDIVRSATDAEKIRQEGADRKKRKKPPFANPPKGGRGRKETGKRTGQQGQIDELLDI